MLEIERRKNAIITWAEYFRMRQHIARIVRDFNWSDFCTEERRNRPGAGD
jgi:hypothetical protein